MYVPSLFFIHFCPQCGSVIPFVGATCSTCRLRESEKKRRQKKKALEDAGYTITKK